MIFFTRMLISERVVVQQLYLTAWTRFIATMKDILFKDVLFQEKKAIRKSLLKSVSNMTLATAKHINNRE